MSHIPNIEEKELIRKLQRGDAIIDLRTREVTCRWSEEFTGEVVSFGYLRRKLIPNRRKLEREQREKEKRIKSAQEEKQALENRLSGGIELTMTPGDAPPEIAERFNIHPGHVYRAVVCGTNPNDSINFDGVLTRIKMYADNKGFTPLEIELTDGLKCTTYSDKEPFDREVIRKGNVRILN